MLSERLPIGGRSVGKPGRRNPGFLFGLAAVFREKIFSFLETINELFQKNIKRQHDRAEYDYHNNTFHKITFQIKA